MDRPYVVCHMLASLDGKIDGAFMAAPEAVAAGKKYGSLREFYACQATLYGTVYFLLEEAIMRKRKAERKRRCRGKSVH